MADTLLKANAFLILHDWVRVISLVLLGLGILYAVIEYRLSFQSQDSGRAQRGSSLRLKIIAGLMVVGVIPAMSLGLFLAERSAHLRQERLMARLDESAQAAAGAIDQFIDKHRSGVMTAASAASSAGHLDRDSMSRWLLLYHGIYVDFLTMLNTDSEGNVVAATSNMSGELTSVPELVSHNVADRPYFSTPMSTGDWFISRVFQGRDLGSDPIVAVSAPLFGSQGERLGIIEGSLNLSAFKEFDDKRMHSDDSEMILLDQRERVIYASATTGLKQLETISSDSMLSTLGQSVAGAEPASDSPSEVPRHVSSSAMTQNGWTVHFRAPLSQISNQMTGDYIVSIAALLIACILSLLLSGGIVRRTATVVALY